MHRECNDLELQISDKHETLKELYADIRKAEKRCKGLNTMIGNLETREADLSDQIDRLESDLESGNGDAEELRQRITCHGAFNVPRCRAAPESGVRPSGYFRTRLLFGWYIVRYLGMADSLKQLLKVFVCNRRESGGNFGVESSSVPAVKVFRYHRRHDFRVFRISAFTLVGGVKSELVEVYV